MTKLILKAPVLFACVVIVALALSTFATLASPDPQPTNPVASSTPTPPLPSPTPLAKPPATATPEATATPLATATPPPAPTPPPTPSPTPILDCTPEFKRNYFNTMHETQNAEVYVNAKQTPPNLTEAAITCEKMNTRFANVICTIPGEDTEPRWDDFSSVCERVSELYAKENGSKISIEPYPPGKLSDHTFLYRLETSRLVLTARKGADLQFAVEQGTKAVAIIGQIMSYVKSIDVNAHTRCMFTHEKGVTPTRIVDDASLKVSDVVESYSPGYHHVKIITDDNRLTILCLSDTSRLHQVRDIKDAFGSLLEVRYRVK